MTRRSVAVRGEVAFGTLGRYHAAADLLITLAPFGAQRYLGQWSFRSESGRSSAGAEFTVSASMQSLGPRTYGRERGALDSEVEHAPPKLPAPAHLHRSACRI